MRRPAVADAPTVRASRPASEPTATAPVTGSAAGSDRRTLRGDRVRIRRTARVRRRVEQAEVRRFTRRARRRSLLAGAAAAVLVLSVAVPTLLSVTPAFALRRVAVTGASPAAADAVRAALKDQLGTPLALVDEAAVRRRVERLPAVRSATLAALPPGTLGVQVVERTAVARVRTGTGYDLVDAEGVPLGAAPASDARTVITADVGAAARPAAVRAAVAVLAALPAGLRARVAAVRTLGPDDVRLTLRSGPRVLWGDADHSAEKAATLTAALVHAAKHARTVDVAAPGVVSVR